MPRDHDGEMYRWRHQVENFLAKIKMFRAIAKRRDKTGVSYAAAKQLSADGCNRQQCPLTFFS